MKKLLFTLLTLLSLAFATPAQAGFEFGIQAGMNLSKVKFDKFNDNFDASNRYGFFVGPKVNFSLLGFGGDAAILYNQKRMNLDEDYSKTFRSIEVPINARYTFGLGSLASVYVSTGPQFGFNVGGKEWTWKGMTQSGTENAFKSTFKRKNMNVSWNIGAGVKLFKHVEAGIGYNIMLSKYAEQIKDITGQDVDSDNYNFKTNTFTIQVAYLF